MHFLIFHPDLGKREGNNAASPTAKSPMTSFNPLPISPHARRRSQQRGKPHEALALVHRHGDLERRAGRDRVRLRLSREACLVLVGAGVPAREVERAARIELVVAEGDNAIVTVLNA